MGIGFVNLKKIEKLKRTTHAILTLTKFKQQT